MRASIFDALSEGLDAWAGWVRGSLGGGGGGTGGGGKRGGGTRGDADRARDFAAWVVEGLGGGGARGAGRSVCDRVGLSGFLVGVGALLEEASGVVRRVSYLSIDRSTSSRNRRTGLRPPGVCVKTSTISWLAGSTKALVPSEPPCEKTPSAETDHPYP